MRKWNDSFSEQSKTPDLLIGFSSSNWVEKRDVLSNSSCLLRYCNDLPTCTLYYVVLLLCILQIVSKELLLLRIISMTLTSSFLTVLA